MTLDIKVFSKSLTIDTHYARNPDAFPVNITGSALNFFVKDTSGPGTFTNNIGSASFYTYPDDSYKSVTVKNKSLNIITANTASNNFYADVKTISPQIISTIPVDNTSLVLTQNTNNNLAIYIENEEATGYASVATTYATDNYYISGDYQTGNDNFPSGTRVIFATLKDLSSDPNDTTASTLDETEIYEFPELTSFTTTEYSGNIASETIITTNPPTSKSFTSQSIFFNTGNEHSNNTHGDPIGNIEIISTIAPTITSYMDASVQIDIADSVSPDISDIIQKRISLVTATNKGAVSKSKANTTTLTFFIKNEADVMFLDKDGVQTFNQVTPFNDPIPPSDESGGGQQGGGGGGGGGGSGSGPIQSWSS